MKTLKFDRASFDVLDFSLFDDGYHPVGLPAIEESVTVYGADSPAFEMYQGMLAFVSSVPAECDTEDLLSAKITDGVAEQLYGAAIQKLNEESDQVVLSFGNKHKNLFPVTVTFVGKGAMRDLVLQCGDLVGKVQASEQTNGSEKVLKAVWTCGADDNENWLFEIPLMLAKGVDNNAINSAKSSGNEAQISALLGHHFKGDRIDWADQLEVVSLAELGMGLFPVEKITCFWGWKNEKTETWRQWQIWLTNGKITRTNTKLENMIKATGTYVTDKEGVTVGVVRENTVHLPDGSTLLRDRNKLANGEWKEHTNFPVPAYLVITEIKEIGEDKFQVNAQLIPEVRFNLLPEKRKNDWVNLAANSVVTETKHTILPAITLNAIASAVVDEVSVKTDDLAIAGSANDTDIPF
jgi:hypothetical protein